MKKNGFTLVELLAVLVIMGLLSLIIVPNVTKYIKSSTKTTYETYKHTLADAAKNYIIDHPEEVPEDVYSHVTNGPVTTLEAKTLIEGGYMESLKEPKNSKKTCDDNSRVFVRLIGYGANDTKVLAYYVMLKCQDHEFLGEV